MIDIKYAEKDEISTYLKPKNNLSIGQRNHSSSVLVSKNPRHVSIILDKRAKDINKPNNFNQATNSNGLMIKSSVSMRTL